MVSRNMMRKGENAGKMEIDCQSMKKSNSFILLPQNFDIPSLYDPYLAPAKKNHPD